MRDESRERRQLLVGIALMCGAVACFSFLDTTAKFLNHHMDTLQVVWARYTFAFLLALVLVNPVPEVPAGEPAPHFVEEPLAGDHFDLAGPNRVEKERGMAVRLGDDGRQQNARADDESPHAEALRAS